MTRSVWVGEWGKKREFFDIRLGLFAVLVSKRDAENWRTSAATICDVSQGHF